MERSIELDTGIEDVWSAVTRPERLSAWFGATAVEAELRPGGRITFDREGTVWRGLVEAVEPPHRFAFRWLPRVDDPNGTRTRVEFLLQGMAKGTRLTVREVPLFEELGVRDLIDAGARS